MSNLIFGSKGVINDETEMILMREVAILTAIILFCHTISGQEIVDQPRITYPAEEIRRYILHRPSCSRVKYSDLKFIVPIPCFLNLELSRIAFIELVNDRNAPVLRKKILLEHGAGEGEFVLPDDLASGIYTVLTYTNWLKNFGETSFNRENIVIVNPDQQGYPFLIPAMASGIFGPFPKPQRTSAQILP